MSSNDIPGPSSVAIPCPSQAGVSRVHELASAAVRAALDGGSTNGSSDTPARPRKLEARKTGVSCRCKRRRCFEHFSEVEKEGIIKDFNEIADKQLQDSHLFGLIRLTEIKRRRPRLSRISGKAPRRANHSYNVSTIAILPSFPLPSSLFVSFSLPSPPLPSPFPFPPSTPPPPPLPPPLYPPSHTYTIEYHHSAPTRNSTPPPYFR